MNFAWRSISVNLGLAHTNYTQTQETRLKISNKKKRREKKMIGALNGRPRGRSNAIDRIFDFRTVFFENFYGSSCLAFLCDSFANENFILFGILLSAKNWGDRMKKNPSHVSVHAVTCELKWRKSTEQIIHRRPLTVACCVRVNPSMVDLCYNLQWERTKKYLPTRDV